MKTHRNTTRSLARVALVSAAFAGLSLGAFTSPAHAEPTDTPWIDVCAIAPELCDDAPVGPVIPPDVTFPVDPIDPGIPPLDEVDPGDPGDPTPCVPMPCPPEGDDPGEPPVDTPTDEPTVNPGVDAPVVASPNFTG